MADKFFITTPIYYVNDEPHLGHAYCTVIADILARYHRLFGDRVFFLTGTDEHGQKVQEAAADSGRSPQEHCDLMVKRFQAVWEKLNISNDDFIRTTEKRHTKVVRDILQQLWDAGEIYTDEYEGWYCVSEERFWTEKDLVEGNCPSCGREVRRLSEKNYFFRMSKYRDWLVDHIKSHPRFILPQSRRNEILGFLNNPLGDLCISRPRERLSWGIPLPFDDQFVTYVWFDALYNYYTAPLSRGGDWWPADIHLIGKDILTTHCVYWPTMLKAAGQDLPKTIFGHGWWLIEETKMSKSLGNVVKPLDLADKYGVDAFRFFLAREMSLGMDASFSEVALVQRYNGELANDLGNLFSRLLKLAATFCDGKLPRPDDDAPAAREINTAAARKLKQKVKKRILDLKINAALDEITAFIRNINRAVEAAAPWKTGKTDPEGTAKFLGSAFNALACAAYLLHPLMPVKMAEICSALGIENPADLSYDDPLPLKIGHPLPTKAALFPRVKLELSQAPRKTEDEDLIGIEQFRQVKMKVARILSAERAPGTQKLLVLKVDLGNETRQLVAGIAQQYNPAELVGKLIVIAANLKPAKIRGIESRGMLLAAQDGDKLAILTPDMDVSPGSEIL